MTEIVARSPVTQVEVADDDDTVSRGERKDRRAGPELLKSPLDGHQGRALTAGACGSLPAQEGLAEKRHEILDALEVLDPAPRG